MVERSSVLTTADFGRGTAEDEYGHLAAYFLETALWGDVLNGRESYIYGQRGSGKSTLYALLLDWKDALEEQGILVVPAENIRDSPVLESLRTAQTLDTDQAIHLWKLYFLTVIGHILQTTRQLARDRDARSVVQILEARGHLPRRGQKWSLVSALAAAAKSLRIRLDFKFDPPLAPFKAEGEAEGEFIFGEPTSQQRDRGYVSVPALFQAAGAALARHNLEVWVALDRLDVALSGSPQEATAMHALLEACADLHQAKVGLAFKLFLRDGITRRINSAGYVMLDMHRFDGPTLQWDRDALLNLLVLRLVANPSICTLYNVDRAEVKQDFVKQQELLYRVFPRQMSTSSGPVDTFQWMLLHTRDATGRTQPRVLVKLLLEARNRERQRMEQGQMPPGEQLFDEEALFAALGPTATFCLERILLAEYPTYYRRIRALKEFYPRVGAFEDSRSECFDLDTLANLWRIENMENMDGAIHLASDLVRVGFFEQVEGQRVYRVPPLYRIALREWE